MPGRPEARRVAGSLPPTGWSARTYRSMLDTERMEGRRYIRQKFEPAPRGGEGGRTVMTPGEPASAREVTEQARPLPYGQVRYGIPTRGAYRLVDPARRYRLPRRG